MAEPATPGTIGRAEISVFPVPLTVRVLSSPRPRVAPRNGEKVTGVVCPGLRSVEPYTGSNRERESTGVIDQNAGTENPAAIDCEDRAAGPPLEESVTF